MLPVRGMTPGAYRQLLLDSIVHDKGFLLVGSTYGMGARGELVGHGLHGQAITRYSPADAVKMLRRLTEAEQAKQLRREGRSAADLLMEPPAP